MQRYFLALFVHASIIITVIIIIIKELTPCHNNHHNSYGWVLDEKDYVQAMMMVGRGLAGMLMCNLSHIVRLLFLACMNCRYIYRASSCMIKDLLNQIQCCVLISQEVGSLSVTVSHSADQPTDLSLFGIQKTTVFSQFCVVRRVKCPDLF